jgi:hypothetical protein
MSYAVSYVLDVAGSVFNARCHQWPQASSAELAELASAGTLWSGNIPSTNITATAELTGLVTLIWLSTKYSVFLADSETAGRIVLWEEAAFEAFHRTKIARLDELLLEQWEESAGEFWFRESLWCQRFWPWLMTQDQTSWKLLTSKPK